MRHGLFLSLMRQLDQAVENGYEDELEDMEPKEILAQLIEETGTREFEEVPEQEMIYAIARWKDQNLD